MLVWAVKTHCELTCELSYVIRLEEESRLLQFPSVDRYLQEYETTEASLVGVTMKVAAGRKHDEP